MQLKINRALLVFLLLIIGTSPNANAQERKLTKGNKQYEQLAFIDAMEVYLEVAESGYKSEELFKRLGNSYYFNSMYVEASKWYGELFALNPDLDAIYSLRYAQSLQAVGDVDTSKQMYDRFMASSEIKTTNKSAKDYLDIIEQNSGRYQITPTTINSDGIDFGTSFYGGKVIFASTKDTASIIKRRSAWDGLSFLDLFEATVGDSGQFTAVQKLKGDVNTNKYHESSVTVTKDGKTMYFTRNNNSFANKPKGKNQPIQLKVYRAHLKDGKWTGIEDLSINGDNYSTAHPVLNANDSRLYFVSDRPESVGQTDIFYSEIDADGKLGRVESLGDKINTPGRESFPFITKDNELYFSSDGHFGLGGYDVFYAQMKGNGFGGLLNVGKPINTAFDDICFVINGHKGYVSSNRPDGSGYDDIYSFVETEDIKELLESRIFGVVTDKETNQAIQGATVTILDSKNKPVHVLKTNEAGYYEAMVDIDTDYIVKAIKEGSEGDDAFSGAGKKEREHNLALAPEIEKVAPGDDIADLLNIIIYFDLDKSNIRPDAAVELEKIVAVMKQHPELKIDVRSHTDSRANDAYNMALSDRRAKSTVAYIVNRGIAKERISGKGYGETELTNKCNNNIKCSENDHQANRRSEFIIRQ